MPNTNKITIHVQERSNLLDRATNLLRDDPRVVAIWLHGSMGRATHDQWSDIDLWIVAADDQMDALREERHTFASAIGPVLLAIEAPQNAPPGGAYLLAMYPGTSGPHTLDCSWQPQSSARRPSDTVLLFDRIGIPAAEPSAPNSPEKMQEEAIAQTRFFWMMTTIVAKYIACRDLWQANNLLCFVASVVHRIEYLAGARLIPPNHHDHPDFDPPATPADQIAALRTLIAGMSQLTAQTSTLHDVVSCEMVEQVDLLCETMVSEYINGQ